MNNVEVFNDTSEPTVMPPVNANVFVDMDVELIAELTVELPTVSDVSTVTVGARDTVMFCEANDTLTWPELPAIVWFSHLLEPAS